MSLELQEYKISLKKLGINLTRGKSKNTRTVYFKLLRHLFDYSA